MTATRTRLSAFFARPEAGGLFGPVERSRVLAALLLLGATVSVLCVGANVLEARPWAAALDAALLAVKLGLAVYVLRSRRLSDRACSAVLGFEVVCADASNLLFPGDMRPFTAQLLPAAGFAALFLPRRHFWLMAGLLLVAATALVIGAEPFGEQALRLTSIVLTGAVTAAVCRLLRAHYAQLTADVSRDALTGVANRRGFDDQATSALAHARRFGEPLGVVIIDLDGFKDVNDADGHPAGDAQLQAVADWLSERARAQDGVARIGGDEFALLLPGTDAAGAAELAHDLVGLASGRLRVGLTMGVAAFPQHGDDVDAVLAAADEALLAGKRQGKARVVVAPPGGRTASPSPGA